MIVSHPARVLFVHVQKTGGSTVQSVLLERLPGAEKLAGLPGAKHAHLAEAVSAYPQLAGYWTFGFVRNPWARMLSWWRMMERFREGAQSGNERHVQHLRRNRFVSAVLASHADFESFVAQPGGRKPPVRRAIRRTLRPAPMPNGARRTPAARIEGRRAGPARRAQEGPGPRGRGRPGSRAGSTAPPPAGPDRARA